MKNHIAQLKASVQNESAYQLAIENLKATKPNRATLVAICEALTVLPNRSGATKTELFHTLVWHGNSERRHEARAEVSRRIMPI